MKIMLVGKYPPIQGGTSRATYWSAHDLVESGHEVEVISNNFEVEPTFRQFLDQQKHSTGNYSLWFREWISAPPWHFNEHGICG